jgi:hypothetical protein
VERRKKLTVSKPLKFLQRTTPVTARLIGVFICYMAMSSRRQGLGSVIGVALTLGRRGAGRTSAAGRCIRRVIRYAVSLTCEPICDIACERKPATPLFDREDRHGHSPSGQRLLKCLSRGVAERRNQCSGAENDAKAPYEVVLEFTGQRIVESHVLLCRSLYGMQAC